MPDGACGRWSGEPRLGKVARLRFPRRSSRLIKPFLSARFVKFAAVGLSGVLVNMATFAVLRALRVHVNLASAVAIEVSILSNFTINHLWTFGDRRHGGDSLVAHGLRFHLVSLGGGLIQFVVFVALNVGWLWVLGGEAALRDYGAGAGSFAERWLWHPFVQPPEVGNLVYLSQLTGIGAATVWNYLLNFYWTWAAGRAAAETGPETVPPPSGP
jgi:putative flippase GtrA